MHGCLRTVIPLVVSLILSISKEVALLDLGAHMLLIELLIHRAHYVEFAFSEKQLGRQQFVVNTDCCPEYAAA